MTDPAETAKARTAALAQSRLDAFVVRARRVEAHSLAKDRVALWNLANPVFYTKRDESGYITSMAQVFPPEEMVESAAARVRPFVLNDELVYHAGVTKTIESAIRAEGTDEMKDTLRVIRNNWNKFSDHSADPLAYSMQVQDIATQKTSQTLLFTSLGFAYLYGDAVHADEGRLADTEEFGVEHRFKAAVPLVAGIMCTTFMTIGFIRQLHDAGLLTISQSALDVPVVVTKTVFEYTEVEVFNAPVDLGRDRPDMNDELPPDWTRV